MKIYGIDFTSAPTRRKPITCAAGDLVDGCLRVEEVERLGNLDAFEAFLERSGPWVAGMDLPFGQPRKLIENLGWPKSWERYVARVEAMSMSEFESLLREYRATRAPGDKHHPRAADHRTGAQSPMTLYRVPVGRMFFRAAPLLMRSGTNVLPCRPRRDARTVLEVYPAMVARKIIGRDRYKSDSRDPAAEQLLRNRRRIVRALGSETATRTYRTRVVLARGLRAAMLDDETGDRLDAVLCALQTAWACATPGYGIPAEADALEGWIVDPATGNADARSVSPRRERPGSPAPP